MPYVAYQTNDKRLLLEVKHPHSKRHLSPIEIVQDPNFYVNLENGQPILKKNKTFYWILLTNIAQWDFQVLIRVILFTLLKV